MKHSDLIKVKLLKRIKNKKDKLIQILNLYQLVFVN